MFFRMIRKALLGQRGGRAMIIFTVALGTCVAASMLSVMFDVGDKVNQELKSYGANITVRPKDAAIVQDLYQFHDQKEQQSYLKESELPNIKTIFWTYNILDFAPLLNVQAEVKNGSDTAQTVPVVGTWFDEHLDLPTGDKVDTGLAKLRPWWKLDGKWPKETAPTTQADAKSTTDAAPQAKNPEGAETIKAGTVVPASTHTDKRAKPAADQTKPQAVVGTRLAKKLGVKPGGTVQVQRNGHDETVAVAAVATTGGDEDDQLFLPLHQAQTLLNKPGAVGQVEVSALTTPDNDLARKAAKNPESLSISERETWYCTAYVSSIAYQIEEVMTDSVARPVRAVSESEGMILEKTQLLMLLVTVLAMAGASLAIANLVTANVMERSREIGLLKAIGARDSSVVGLLLTEILLIGLVGGAVGFGVGVGLAQLIGHLVFSSSITVAPAVALIVSALVLLVVLGGCIPAVRYLLRLRPAEVLHGR
ncbi:ABC transporter permease [Gleimia hominis]|uniref:ABC transporter permease n=1 Tax=Gleimia hominis TaxID=595468 RepID=UPI000C801340|nr:ABC transporter permease [Gleimia hominis]WIK64662.1 FtsX-like permease family protein [Gleimia hominis]